MLDPFTLLERTDKWYLGNGRTTLFAPAFPQHLDTPGFWDEAYFADIRLERLFCLLLLDEAARPLVLRRATRRWTPARLTQIYTVEGRPGIRVQEERVVTARDTLATRLTLTNATVQPIRVQLIQWSLQAERDLPPDEFAATVAEVAHEPDALTFAHHIHYGKPGDTPADVQGWGEREDVGRRASEVGNSPNADDSAEPPQPYSLPSTPYALSVALGASRLPDSWTTHRAETSDASPLWEISVVPEKFRGGRLAQEPLEENGGQENGMVHLALHYDLEIPPNGAESLTMGASIALDRETALAHLRADMTGDVVVGSWQDWTDYFAGVPYFECSDPYLTRYYWYRWYGLRLSTVRIATGALPFPCVFEGIGAFRSHVSYSAQCHMRETAWMHNPDVAFGSLENFLASQVQDEEDANDGFLPGHLYLWRRDRGFYHTNWGGAARHVYAITGDKNFLRRIYPGLVRYAEYFDRERDKEGIGLYDVLDQGETGQEYSSRYLFASDTADSWRPFQLKGVDASCYMYELQRALAYFARELGQEADAAWWNEKADGTRDSIRGLMWDGDAFLFKDVDPETLEHSPYLAAVGFYPFLSDIATKQHDDALDLLFEFGTTYLIPSSGEGDPYFSAEADWKGRRVSCPWNGRVWPMLCSHIMDALANAARTLPSNRRSIPVMALNKFVRMMFFDGDETRPNAFEHYNPLTGMPSLYRGIDDYQHSWVVDLILRHVAGIQPEPGPGTNAMGETLVIDPLPFNLNMLRAENIHLRGHTIDVVWNLAEGFVVRVDGQERVQLPDVQSVEIRL